MTVLHPLTPHHAAHSLLPALTAFRSALPALTSPPSLWRSWAANPATDPLHPAVAFALATSAVVFVLGELTGNVSQVDRLWTVLPVIYSAHFTFWPLVTGQVSRWTDLDPRMLLVLALQCAWSARLTYQSARRGFLDPRSEDYRWPIVRRRLPRWAFTLLDLTFISVAQNLLLLAAELPQYLLLSRDLAASTHLAARAKLRPHHVQVARVPLNLADLALALGFVVTLVLEMRADNQQQAFQRLKHNALDKQRRGQALTPKEQSAVQRGFVAEGLWSWSRHPNFACEQTTWYLLYAFTVLPFLPASQSIASHPLSALGTPAALLGSTSTALAHLARRAGVLPKYLDLDAILTAVLHPLLTLRGYAPASVSAAVFNATTPGQLGKYLAKARLAGLIALAEVRADEGVHWNYAIVAPLLMSVLFFSSTILTEQISGNKYPLYATYRRRVAKFWPVLTPLKGLYLVLTGGRRARIDRRIWGTLPHEGVAPSSAKTLKAQ